MCYNYGRGVSLMKVYKKNLPKGVKKQFATVKGVKVKFIAKNKNKKVK